ncbi:serine/threonine-protein kinase [Streptomyces sp. NPDC097619]|uniref:serine/threonine-protein kinase n=1 Tax=Streptomyces sp. NPDC097619 TaxID=3157228 RepID=UPI003320E3EB
MDTMLHPDDPERLGGYWLAARLGAGSQGVVYEAYDEQGARVAVKALHRDAQQFVRDRFAKEVEAARLVAPFCTARILDAAVAAEAPFIVSEYIPGPTLGAAVRAHGTFDAEATTRLAAGVATALAAIHQAKVVHRDLKPGNVLLGPDGPRVIDFGIARASDMSLTATGAIMGTFGYMAPEVLAGGRATPAADVFAWGALVLYAASGEEPFRGDNIGQVAHRTAAVDPDLSALPAPLRPLVAAALAKEPGLRPTATELLLGLVGETPAAADPRRALLEAGARRSADPRPEADRPGLGERAERAYAGLPFGAQQAAHEILLRLVVPGEDPDGSQDSVRTASYEELFAGRGETEAADGHAAVTALRAAGALLVGEDHAVRPVSAALIRAWTRLRAWTEADRAALALRHRLGQSARAWQQHGSRPEDLVQGTALREALDWSAAAGRHVRPNPLEAAFLEAGRVTAGRTVRRRRQLLGGLGVLLVVALLAGGLAWQQSRAAAREQARAAARTTAQAAASLRAADPKAAMLLGVAAWRIAHTEDSRAALLGGRVQREADVVELPAEAATDRLTRRVLSADGRYLAALVGADTQIWDLKAGRVTATTKGRADLKDVAFGPFSPDGRLLLGQGENGYRVFEAATLKPVGREIALDRNEQVVELTSGGLVLKRPLIASGYTLTRASDGSEVSAGPERATVSPDGAQLATCDGGSGVRLWKVKGGRLDPVALDEADGGATACQRLVFSPDGRFLAAQMFEGHRVWRTADGSDRGRVESGSDDAQFSSGGKYLFWYETESGLIRMAATDRALVELPAYRVRTSRVKPNEARIALAIDDAAHQLVFHRSETRTVEKIDLVETPETAARLPSGSIQSVDVSGDGRIGMVRPLGVGQQLLDLRSGRLLGSPVPEREPGQSKGWTTSDLSDDGKLLAFNDQGDMVVWDVARRKEVLRKRADVYYADYLALAPDGRRLAFYSQLEEQGNGTFNDRPGHVYVWDVPSGRQVVTFESEPGNLAFDREADRLVTSRGELVDLATGRVRKHAFGPNPASDVVFSPDAGTLAVAQRNGWLQLWDGAVTRRGVALPSKATSVATDGYGAQLSDMAFSADGRLAAALVGADKVQFWDLESGLALGDALDPGTGMIGGLAFDGQVLRILSPTEPFRSLDTDPEALVAGICARVGGRELTPQEWGQYVPEGTPYRKVCS